MKIAHFGTFDVENYGDLLFPPVAQHYLAGEDTAFVWISPKGGRACPDAVETIGVLDLPWRDLTFDLALIGGGNIVTPSATKLQAYAKPRQLGWIAYPSLWLSACLKAAECGAAIAWNAPGVMRPPWPQSGKAALAACLRMSDYISLREREALGWMPPDLKKGIRIVPDTAITLSRIWPKGTLEADFATARSRSELGGPYFIVHLKARNLEAGTEPAERRKVIASLIDATAEAIGMTPLLVPIGRCHGDDVFLRGLASDMTGPVAVASDVHSLRETTALIANAAYVFSASLHCSIIAASYGVPTRLLQYGKAPKYRSFFGDHLDLRETVVERIEDGLDAKTIASATDGRAAMRAAVEKACEEVEAHFAAIRAAATAPIDRSTRGEKGRRDLFDAVGQASPISGYLPAGVLLA